MISESEAIRSQEKRRRKEEEKERHKTEDEGEEEKLEKTTEIWKVHESIGKE